MHFQPSWQHDHLFNSETNTARSPFRSAPTIFQCHSHHICVWQTLHALMRLRIKKALHCMYLVKLMFHQLSFPVMSATMHRPCMTSCTSVNPTTKHLSLVRHGHLRCLPSLPETSTEGTEIHAMSAIWMQSDMISTCFNFDTQHWCVQMCITEQTCVKSIIVQFMDWFLYVARLCHPCVKPFVTSLSRPTVVWTLTS